jgi:hypothetical protein
MVTRNSEVHRPGSGFEARSRRGRTDRLLLSTDLAERSDLDLRLRQPRMADEC